MWMALAAGLNVAGSLAQYGADKAQAKANKAVQEYRNKMTRIADAINQNAITTNTTLAIQNSARQAVFMRRDEISTLGSTVVAAAAAGVRGNSVNKTLLDVKRNAAVQERMRQVDLEQQFLQFDQQRLSSALQAEQNRDYSYIATPKLGTYLLSAGTKVAGMYASKA